MSLLAPIAELGALIVPMRIRRWTIAALVAQLAALFVTILGTHGLLVALSKPVTTDFASFYAAGTLAGGSAPALVYSRAAHYAAEQIATQPGIAYVYFFYPPIYLFICTALAHLPYIVSFLLFEALTAAALLVTLRLIIGVAAWWCLLPALSFSPLIWNIGVGQNACLTASLFGGATLLLHARRPTAAGLLFACLCYKPHFGLLIPMALAAGGERRAFMAASLGVTVIAALSVLVFGAAPWLAFLHAIPRVEGEFSAGKIVGLRTLVSTYAAARMLGAGELCAYGVEIAAAVAVAACVLWSWRHRHGANGIHYAVLTSGTLLIMPVALFYDLVILLVSAAWIVRAAAPVGLRNHERLGLASIWLAGLFCYPIAGSMHVPLGTICACGLFSLALTRQRCAGVSSPIFNNMSSFWMHKDKNCPDDVAISFSLCVSKTYPSLAYEPNTE